MKRKILFSIALLSLAAGYFFVGNSATVATAESEVNPFYVLDFADTQNRGKNNVDLLGKLDDATIVDGGKIKFGDKSIKGKPALSMVSSGNRKNYVEIPGTALNGDSLTIAGWFYIDSSIASWARILEINANDDRNYLSIMPVAPNYYNGIHINTKLDGTILSGANSDNMLFEGPLQPCEVNAPKAGYILPVYDTWVHYAYELTPTGFSYYQNGKLLKTLAGDFSASRFFGDNSKVYLGATAVDQTPDFTGSFADIRFYSSALTEEEIISEYDLTYRDFLTTSYDFEDGLKESIRGYDATARGNAKVERDEERNSNVLVLDGSVVEGYGTKGRTSIDMPNNTLKGHNQLTVSMDIYIDSNTPAYSRIFDASPIGAQYLTFGAKWQASGNTYLQFTSNHGSGYEGIYKACEFNRWMNVTMTVDKDYAAIYYDGVLVSEGTNLKYMNSILWDVNQPTPIGRTDFWGDNPFMGKIDNFKVYQTVLTEREIMEENNIIVIEDDTEAVNHQKDLLTLNFDGTQGFVELPTYLEDGVKVKWTSSHPEIISTIGEVFFPENPTEVTLTAELSRGKAKATKEFKYTLTHHDINISVREAFDYDEIFFTEGSYYEGLMKSNLDYMLSLNKDRLLYNYRRISGVSTKGASSYGNWISPTGNGAGQFEAHYVVALAKASKTMPDYSYKGETVLDRLTYMLESWDECQKAFAEKYPEEAGYLGAIITDNYKALEDGRTVLVDGTSRWVPWYFHHKTLEALVDVTNECADPDLRELGKEMLRKVADWTANKVNNYDEATKNKVLSVEYGGMGETMFQIYKIFGDKKYFDCGKIFEEPNLMTNTYKGIDTLSFIHANTTIPKFLAAAAEYEVTGNEYYKTVCINAFDMIMTRTYANGSTSKGEFWQEPEHTDLGVDTAETCCSYNMLKLADYLYRWTGDAKYLDYYENVFNNHILSSMIPELGLKTYLTNYGWGYYKIYHTPDNSFWCCACSGMESFAQLASRVYYRDLDHTKVEVNMYYPSVVVLKDDATMTQENMVDLDGSAKFVINGNLGNYTVSLRVPSWTKTVEVLYNGSRLNISPVDGFINITKDFKDGDVITMNFDFKYEMIKLRGSDNQYAIKYGPNIFVCDLGSEGVDDIKPSQTDFGPGYSGDINDKIVLKTGEIETSSRVQVANGEIKMEVETLNQGKLTFVPFNQIFRNRYGMYFKYFDTVEECFEEYTVEGNEKTYYFDEKTDDMEAYGTSSTSSAIKYTDCGLEIAANGEYKLVTTYDMKQPYTIDVSISPAGNNGQMNCGVYLLAGNPANGQDMITGYNVQLEKAQGSNVATVTIYKFNNAYLGNLASGGAAIKDGEVRLHILVKDDRILVFANDNQSSIIDFAIEKDFVGNNGKVGIRSQFCASVFNYLTITSPDFEVEVTSLVKAVENAGKVDKSKYTKTSVADLSAKVEAANVVIAKSEPTQKEISDALAALKNAMNKLVLKGSTSNLDRLLATEQNYKEENYTTDSYAVLKQAFDAAKAADYDDLSQEQVDALYNACFDAILNLKVKTGEESVIDSTPGESTNPGTSEGKSTGGCGGNIYGISLIAALVSICGLAVAILKKKHA